MPPTRPDSLPRLATLPPDFCELHFHNPADIFSDMNSCCPYCRQELQIDASMSGQLVACPRCFQHIQIPFLPVGTPVTSIPNVPGEFDFPAEASSVSGVRYSSASRGDLSRSNDSLKMFLGILGSIVLFLGVFAPFIKAPLIGSVNYFQNGHGDGVIVLVLAGISFILVLTRTYMGLWITGLSSMAVLAFTFINFHLQISELKEQTAKELDGNPFSSIGEAMVKAISFDWGFGVLIVGAVLAIAAAAVPRK